MLEGAKEKKSVFIQNYVQVMRRCRPYMVQKEVSKTPLHFYCLIYIDDDGFGGGNEDAKEKEE